MTTKTSTSRQNNTQVFCRKGFTLIELLVVVLIIGILSSVALPQYNKAVWKSRYATIKQQVKSIKEAEEVFFMSNGRYTSSWDELDLDVASEASAGQSGIGSHERYKKIGSIFLNVGTHKDSLGAESIWQSLSKSTTDRETYLVYAQILNNSPVYPGKQLCQAQDSVGESICAAESQLSAPTKTTGKWKTYIW